MPRAAHPLCGALALTAQLVLLCCLVRQEQRRAGDGSPALTAPDSTVRALRRLRTDRRLGRGNSEPTRREERYEEQCTLVFQFCLGSKPGKALPNSFGRSPDILQRKSKFRIVKYRINELQITLSDSSSPGEETSDALQHVQQKGANTALTNSMNIQTLPEGKKPPAAPRQHPLSNCERTEALPSLRASGVPVQDHSQKLMPQSTSAVPCRARDPHQGATGHNERSLAQKVCCAALLPEADRLLGSATGAPFQPSISTHRTFTRAHLGTHRSGDRYSDRGHCARVQKPTRNRGHLKLHSQCHSSNEAITETRPVTGNGSSVPRSVQSPSHTPF